MFVVGFNGPPESGKDTLARFVAEHMDAQGVTLPVVETSLSIPLRRIAYCITGYEGKQLEGLDYEEFKRTFFPQFNCTGRQIMIDSSEKFLKPCYGQGVMAKLLMAQYAWFQGVLLVRDSGFQCEVEPLSAAVGAANLYIVNVWREGKSFDGDSREWVTHTQQTQIENNGTLDDLRTEAGRVYSRMVNNLGWKL